MSKAILVIDAPEEDYCDGCQLCISDGKSVRCAGKEMAEIKGAADASHGVFIIYYPIPKDCPLKEVPSYVQDRTRPYAYSEDEAAAYNDGWNDCLEKIMGDDGNE